MRTPLENSFNQAIKALGKNQMFSPRYFEIVNNDLPGRHKVKVKAASNTTCIFEYIGRKYYAFYDYISAQIKIERI